MARLFLFIMFCGRGHCQICFRINIIPQATHPIPTNNNLIPPPRVSGSPFNNFLIRTTVSHTPIVAKTIPPIMFKASMIIRLLLVFLFCFLFLFFFFLGFGILKEVFGEFGTFLLVEIFSQFRSRSFFYHFIPYLTCCEVGNT